MLQLLTVLFDLIFSIPGPSREEAEQSELKTAARRLGLAFTIIIAIILIVSNATF